MNNIDQLRTEVDDIKNSLNGLKNDVSLSENEKKAQAETLKSQADDVRQKIEDEISSLEGETDDESKKQKKKAETLLGSFEEITDLYTSILSSKEIQDSEDESILPDDSEQDGKGFFGKTWDWTKEQWGDIWDKDKRKNDTSKNILRTAGFAATGVGALVLLGKGLKKIFGKEKWEGRIEGYENMTRKQKREARKEWKKNRKEEKEKKRQKRKGLKEAISETVDSVNDTIKKLNGGSSSS